MVTPEQIENWKQQYGEVSALEVRVSAEDTAVAYLKPADRNVVAFALSKTMQNKLLEAGEFILINTFIGGDERLRLKGQAEGPVQIAAAIAAAQSVELLDAQVKKL